jgi:hypothetical protein
VIFQPLAAPALGFEQHVAAGIAIIRRCADGLDHANVAI